MISPLEIIDNSIRSSEEILRRMQSDPSKAERNRKNAEEGLNTAYKVINDTNFTQSEMKTLDPLLSRLYGGYMLIGKYGQAFNCIMLMASIPSSRFIRGSLSDFISRAPSEVKEQLYERIKKIDPSFSYVKNVDQSGEREKVEENSIVKESISSVRNMLERKEFDKAEGEAMLLYKKYSGNREIDSLVREIRSLREKDQEERKENEIRSVVKSLLLRTDEENVLMMILRGKYGDANEELMTAIRNDKDNSNLWLMKSYVAGKMGNTGLQKTFLDFTLRKFPAIRNTGLYKLLFEVIK
jgi:hypothetical protein